MNSKEFLIALRTLIREEVRAAVRAELRVLNESKLAQPSIRVTPEEIIQTTSNKSALVKKKTFTKDPLLNDLLNDTATRTLNITEGYDTIGMYSSEMAQGFGMTRSTERSISPTHDLDGRPVNMNNDSVATVVNAMTKDYSALMKAIDKKKGVS